MKSLSFASNPRSGSQTRAAVPTGSRSSATGAFASSPQCRPLLRSRSFARCRAGSSSGGSSAAVRFCCGWGAAPTCDYGDEGLTLRRPREFRGEPIISLGGIAIVESKINCCAIRLFWVPGEFATSRC